MPGRDGTGPMGQGSFTGRGLGNCINYGLPLVAGAIAAFGFGRRRGFGFGRGLARGFGRGFGFGANGFQWQQGAVSQDEELSVLKDQAQTMESSLKEINNRISELEQK